jgi:hypothetical protein
MRDPYLHHADPTESLPPTVGDISVDEVGTSGRRNRLVKPWQRQQREIMSFAATSSRILPFKQDDRATHHGIEGFRPSLSVVSLQDRSMRRDRPEQAAEHWDVLE